MLSRKTQDKFDENIVFISVLYVNDFFKCKMFNDQSDVEGLNEGRSIKSIGPRKVFKKNGIQLL